MNRRQLLAGLALAVAVTGCELAVHPDLSLAEVPVPPCEVCLSDADTVVTEPDGNVLIVPTDTLDGGEDGDSGGDDASDGAEVLVDP